MKTYKQAFDNLDCVLWQDGKSSGSVRKGTLRNGVDVWQQLLDQDTSGEVTIEWLTAADIAANLEAQEAPLADRALQEALTKIDALETRLAALEATP